MTEPISDAERIALRERHVPASQFSALVSEGMCLGCRVNERWPCLTVRLLAQLDAKDKEVIHLKEQVALRHQGYLDMVKEWSATMQELRKLGDALERIGDVYFDEAAVFHISEVALANAPIYRAMKGGRCSIRVT